MILPYEHFKLLVFTIIHKISYPKYPNYWRTRQPFKNTVKESAAQHFR